MPTVKLYILCYLGNILSARFIELVVLTFSNLRIQQINSFNMCGCFISVHGTFPMKTTYFKYYEKNI
jgi:hypothetical protein